MRVAKSGAGPAGLLFSLLAKRRYPSWRIEVAEQNPEGATYGFGVVFSDGALAFLERDEPQLSNILEAVMERWPVQRILHRDEREDIDGNGFSAIGRLALQEILRNLCRDAGVGRLGARVCAGSGRSPSGLEQVAVAPVSAAVEPALVLGKVRPDRRRPAHRAFLDRIGNPPRVRGRDRPRPGVRGGGRGRAAGARGVRAPAPTSRGQAARRRERQLLPDR